MFNFIKKLFIKEKPEYEITKWPRDIFEEDFKMMLDEQCPVCGHQNEIHGGCTDGEYNYYTCQNDNCRAEWKVRCR